MAEVNKNYKEMWSLLAESEGTWENEPTAETLTNNVFFHSLMNAVNNLVRTSSDYTLTDKERKNLIKEMTADIASADWCAKLAVGMKLIKEQEDEEISDNPEEDEKT